MFIITAVSLIGLAVVITLIAIGVVADNQDIICSGIIALLVWILSHALFQLGANWQHNDTLVNYKLEPKIQIVK